MGITDGEIIINHLYEMQNKKHNLNILCDKYAVNYADSFVVVSISKEFFFNVLFIINNNRTHCY